MDKSDLIDFLRYHLSIETEEKQPPFGGKKYVEIKIKLDGEVISSDTFDKE